MDSFYTQTPYPSPLDFWNCKNLVRNRQKIQFVELEISNIKWRWIFWRPPPSSCPRSYWMAPNQQHALAFPRTTHYVMNSCFSDRNFDRKSTVCRWKITMQEFRGYRLFSENNSWGILMTKFCYNLSTFSVGKSRWQIPQEFRSEFWLEKQYASGNLFDLKDKQNCYKNKIFL